MMATMGDRIHGQQIRIKHHSELSSVKKNILRQTSLSVTHVKKVSLSRRHRSLQIQPSHASIKKAGSQCVVHVTVRPSTNNVFPKEHKITNTNDYLHVVNSIRADTHQENDLYHRSLKQDLCANGFSRLDDRSDLAKQKETAYSNHRNPRNESNRKSKKRTNTSTTITPTTTIALTFGAITRAGDSIMGLYNTTAGQPTGASNGTYSSAAEGPDKAIDGSISSKYLNFGFQGFFGAVLNQPGVTTGFYVTPTISNSTIACGLLFATGNDFPDRDPITITLEGTNAAGTTALNLGSSWTLLYSGPTGIDPLFVTLRSTYVPQQNFSNTIAYMSYRLLVTSQRNISDAVQYAEAQIMGYF